MGEDAVAPTLTQGPHGLELRLGDAALRADFVGGRLGWRLAHGGGRRQLVARAVGLHRRSGGLRVLDATAGLGRDAAVLAALGCEVLAVERHALVFALLEDALARAEADPATRERLGGRLRLLHGDAREVLADAGAHGGWDAVVLDPMHPPRTGSALTRQEMRLFRELVGDDEDAAALLAAALDSGAPRVAVKRPLRGEPLPGPSPQGRVLGRTTRYDLYLGAGTRSESDG